MKDETDSQPGRASRRSKNLLRLTSLYGLVYLIFIILSFIPGRVFGDIFEPGGGHPVSTTVPFEPFDQEQIFVKLLFLLFLLGYLVLLRHKGVGGAILILWYVAAAAVEVFVVAPISPDDWGMGLVAGFPLFVLGILFVVGWYRGRRVEA